MSMDEQAGGWVQAGTWMHDRYEQVEGGGVTKGRWEGSVCATPVGAAPAPAAVTMGVGVVVAGVTPRTNEGQCK